MTIAASPTAQPISAAELKERRARDAAQAMRDYEAKRVATLAKTARLRAIRLAKEAEGSGAAPKKKGSLQRAR
jgi:hypothetical protein